MTEQLMAQGISRNPVPSSVETDFNAAERELDMQISRLNELTSDLAVRLNRILRQPVESKDAMTRPTLEMDSDVSNMIMASADRLRRIANQVEDLLRRVDL